MSSLEADLASVDIAAGLAEAALWIPTDNDIKVSLSSSHDLALLNVANAVSSLVSDHSEKHLSVQDALTMAVFLVHQSEERQPTTVEPSSYYAFEAESAAAAMGIIGVDPAEEFTKLVARQTKSVAIAAGILADAIGATRFGGHGESMDHCLLVARIELEKMRKSAELGYDNSGLLDIAAGLVEACLWRDLEEHDIIRLGSNFADAVEGVATLISRSVERYSERSITTGAASVFACLLVYFPDDYGGMGSTEYCASARQMAATTFGYIGVDPETGMVHSARPIFDEELPVSQEPIVIWQDGRETLVMNEDLVEGLTAEERSDVGRVLAESMSNARVGMEREYARSVKRARRQAKRAARRRNKNWSR